MVYETNYYSTHRPYGYGYTSYYSPRPNISSYSVTRREVPWEKVPFVARPSLIADPITAFGRRKPITHDQTEKSKYHGSIVQRLKAEIIPKPLSQLRPLETYKSPRDLTRDKVANEIHYHQRVRELGGIGSYLTDKHSLDVVLPRIHANNRIPSYVYDDDYYTPSYYSYQTPLRVPISYPRVSSYISRPSLRLNYDTDYDDEPYYSSPSYYSSLSQPLTRISTLPSRVYRERISPVRMITTPTRIYRDTRKSYSPVRIVSSPTTVVSTRVRPSVLSREFDRIEHKYRPSPVGLSDTDEYLNYWKTNNFNDEARDIRTTTKKLMREVNEPVIRNKSYTRYARASSSEPVYSRFDPDLVDKYGNQQINNEYYVNREILRPTRNTRDQIEILSNLKYRDPGRRYIGISRLASARIVGDRPYYTRKSLAHDFDPSNYTNEKVRNDVNYLSFYSKSRDAAAANESVKKEKTTFENKPLVVVKPSVVSEGKIQTVAEVSSTEVEEKSD